MAWSCSVALALTAGIGVAFAKQPSSHGEKPAKAQKAPPKVSRGAAEPKAIATTPAKGRAEAKNPGAKHAAKPSKNAKAAGKVRAKKAPRAVKRRSGSTPGASRAGRAGGAGGAKSKGDKAAGEKRVALLGRAKAAPLPPDREPASPRLASLPLLSRAIACPADMVAVAGRVCVDRYETSLVDKKTGGSLSPYYSPNPASASLARSTYLASRETARDNTLEKLLALPPIGSSPTPVQTVALLPSDPGYAPEIESKNASGVVPSGYLTGVEAELACISAGKRLCSQTEWVTACRGEAQRAFPYGDKYESGKCNVFREAHPAQLLHGSASHHHTDPRLNLVRAPDGNPLLRLTGATPSCASTWGSDAVYDMVGNLDEWVQSPTGAFMGGFYSRATTRGCDAKISSHPRAYHDYSLGVRCCKDPEANDANDAGDASADDEQASMAPTGEPARVAENEHAGANAITANARVLAAFTEATGLEVLASEPHPPAPSP